MGLSLLEVLDGGYRCKRAFFTTFAFSASFFDSYILPRLKKAGCEKIVVLVDAKGYSDSLMEQKSRYVGQEYLLIPVWMKEGIFHPKITYLWGEHPDLLFIGSGNLTHGGHGGNLEVVECLKPDADAECFADFATFLAALETSAVISIPDTSVVEELRSRANSVLVERMDKGKGGTKLLHSIDRPVLDQLLDDAATTGGWEELLILSPYHSESGTALKKLAAGLGVKRIMVGIPTNKKEPSSFPVASFARSNFKVSYVKPKLEGKHRRLHAKWIELRGSSNWALTGSINATSQSLATTKNVEIGVLRKLQAATTAMWEIADKPEHFAPSDFRFSQASSALLYARVDERGRINGSIVGVASPQGHWDACLESPDAVLDKASIEVSTDGSFDWRQSWLPGFDDSFSVQLRLTRDLATARGWLSQQTLLEMPSESRSVIRALGRMLNRSESIDDVKTLLDYIAMHTGKLDIGPKSPPGSNSSERKDDTGDDPSFSIRDLGRSGDENGANPFTGLVTHIGVGSDSWQIISGIVQLLAGRKAGKPAGKRVAGQGRIGGEDEDEDERFEAKTQDAVEHFDEVIRHELVSAEGAARSRIFWLWGNVGLLMRLRESDDTENAHAFATQWLKQIAKYPPPEDERKRLDGIVYGVAASLAFRGSKIGADMDAHRARVLSGPDIHQSLESYACGAVEPKFAIDCAREWLSRETTGTLVGEHVQEACDGLGRVLSKTTRRAVLRRLIDTGWTVELEQLLDEIFPGPERALVTRLTERLADKRGYRVLKPNDLSCPGCSYSLDGDTKVKLRTRRIATCMHCNHILLWI